MERVGSNKKLGIRNKNKKVVELNNFEKDLNRQLFNSSLFISHSLFTFYPNFAPLKKYFFS
jgi:hypothetical protein